MSAPGIRRVTAQPVHAAGLLAAALFCLLGPPVAGCASPRVVSGSWGPVVVDASPLPPRTLLQTKVVGGEGDLEDVLRAAILEARLGSSSTSIFTLSVRPRERRTEGGHAHVVSLRFSLARGGARLAEDEIAASASTAPEARRLALGRLVARAAPLLARLDDPRPAMASGFDLPAIVVVERVAHSRDLLELSFVETIGGAVVRREIVPLADAAAGPPGRFVLSRRTVEGQRLDDEGYAALVRRVSPFLDLRPIGDAQRLGYFGAKSAVSAPAGSASSPRASTPPRR